MVIADLKHCFQSWTNGADDSSLTDGAVNACVNNGATTIGLCMTAGMCQRNYVIIPGKGY